MTFTFFSDGDCTTAPRSATGTVALVERRRAPVRCVEAAPGLPATTLPRHLQRRRELRRVDQRLRAVPRQHRRLRDGDRVAQQRERGRDRSRPVGRRSGPTCTTRRPSRRPATPGSTPTGTSTSPFSRAATAPPAPRHGEGHGRARERRRASVHWGGCPRCGRLLLPRPLQRRRELRRVDRRLCSRSRQHGRAPRPPPSCTTMRTRPCIARPSVALGHQRARQGDRLRQRSSGVRSVRQRVFTFFANGDCDRQGTAAGTVALANGVAHPSTASGALAAGNYSFQAPLQRRRQLRRLDERLRAVPRQHGRLHDRHATAQRRERRRIALNSSVALGTNVHDKATVSDGNAGVRPDRRRVVRVLRATGHGTVGAAKGTVALVNGVAHPSEGVQRPRGGRLLLPGAATTATTTSTRRRAPASRSTSIPPARLPRPSCTTTRTRP